MDNSVDVKYDNSGATTIMISGTPVNKRRQIFEASSPHARQKTVDGHVQPNESAKVLISSMPTALPDAEPNNNSNKYQTNEKNSNRKKVTFTEAVVINDDETTQFASDENEAINQNGVATDDVEIVQMDNSKSTLTNANETHPLKQQKLKSKFKEPDVLVNGTAFVPIVDEYEVRELSNKLSSKDDIRQNKLSSTDETDGDLNSKDSVVIQNFYNQDTNESTTDSSSVKGTKSKCEGGRCVLLWAAVVVIGIALVGIIALTVLYTRQFQVDDDIVKKLKNRLNLRSSSNSDLFVRALLSSKQENVVYYLSEEKDYIPWQKPNRTATLSWHRGTTLNIYSIQNGQWRRRKLGDTYEDSIADYHLEISTDTWYAANLDDKSDSYVLLSTISPDGNLGWIQSTNLAAQYPELEDDIRPFNRP